MNSHDWTLPHRPPPTFPQHFPARFRPPPAPAGVHPQRNHGPMNGNTYTIAQALASQLSNLQVVDTAADIANALPDFGLTSRVASFSLAANGALSAALADRLAALGPKYHAAGFLLTVTDT